MSRPKVTPEARLRVGDNLGDIDAKRTIDRTEIQAWAVGLGKRKRGLR
jgi:hypothetical protein